jgi:hypothetical protein
MLLFCFMVCASLLPSAHAQEASSWIGVRAGVNLAGESLDSELDGTSTGLKAGLIAGVQFDHWFSDMFAVSVQALYDQKGVHEEYGPSLAHPNVNGGTEDFTFSYLEVPVLLKVGFGDASVKPYAFVGPSFGFLMSATDKQALTGSDIIPSQSNNFTSFTPPNGSVDYKPYLQSSDISILFGVGLLDEINETTMLVFDAGYAAWLAKVYKSAPPDRIQQIDNTSAKSGDIRIAIGMMWKL